MRPKMRKFVLIRLQAMLTETFGFGPAATFSVILLTTLAMALAAFWFVHSAPPNTITITSGPEGSIFQADAEKYRKILARNGVKLKIIQSQGSLENLQRLNDTKYHVDIGFIQGGVSNGIPVDKLVSLGSLFNEPLLVFYRGSTSIDLLSGLKGKRLAIGREGSGTRSLALALLKVNGIEPGGATPLVDLEAKDAAQALLDGKVDAVFLMGDSAGPPVMRELLRGTGIRLMDFSQADAYTRRFVFLNKLELPKGSIDFGKNMPKDDLYLIGPTVELVAREDLHPALSDLLLEAAREVHGGATLLQRRGEFPAPLEHEIRISDDANRYYKSGKSFLYRYLPYWLASLANRLLVVIVPIVVLLIPGLRIVPSLYRWRIKLNIYRRYRALLTLERDMLAHLTREGRTELIKRLDEIERVVNGMKVPVSFADQFYVLRQHIDYVRSRLMGSVPSSRQ